MKTYKTRGVVYSIYSTGIVRFDENSESWEQSGQNLESVDNGKACKHRFGYSLTIYHYGETVAADAYMSSCRESYSGHTHEFNLPCVGEPPSLVTLSPAINQVLG